MQMDLNWFLLGPIPSNTMGGTYNYKLVILSYVISVLASYVALDLAGRLRATTNNITKFYWLVGGAFSMGAGIWSMHFIGMLAFIMNMPMYYDIFWTGFSMVAAILASGLTMYLLRTEDRPLVFMALGGIFLGLGICTMHYMGMTGMEGVKIRYLPSLFFLSIAIAIAASWVALWLALQSNRGKLGRRFRLKVLSAFIMGAAICGMHYTGMAAAVFFHSNVQKSGIFIEPNTLALYVAGVTATIIGLALLVSTYQQLVDNAIQKEKDRYLQQQLIIARQAGMAEVADCVLHNVGNVLNSVNVSVSVIEEKLLHSELDGLTAVREMIDHNKENIGDFITNDTKGSHLPDYFIALANYWQKEKKIIIGEINTLVKNVQHIKDIITMQQALSKVFGAEEAISIEDLIKDALEISGINFEHYGIIIERFDEKMPNVLVDKSKVMQIVINLLRNAKDALTESTLQEKRLIIKTGQLPQNKFFIQITDNGVGILPKNLKLIFSHGFTTKEKGHGFGLHTSAIVAKEMGGRLTAESKGQGKGATFTLELPIKFRNGTKVLPYKK